jgi:hypothetical protein
MMATPAQACRKATLLYRSLRIMVTQAHFNLICKELLHRYVADLNRLSKQHAAIIDLDNLQPREYVEAARVTMSLLYFCGSTGMQSLRQYTAVPAFREFFPQTQEEGKPPMVAREDSVEHNQTGKEQLSNIVDRVTGELTKACEKDLSILHHGLNLVDTSLRKGQNATSILPHLLSRTSPNSS